MKTQDNPKTLRASEMVYVHFTLKKNKQKLNHYLKASPLCESQRLIILSTLIFVFFSSFSIALKLKTVLTLLNIFRFLKIPTFRMPAVWMLRYDYEFLRWVSPYRLAIICNQKGSHRTNKTKENLESFNLLLCAKISKLK